MYNGPSRASFLKCSHDFSIRDNASCCSPRSERQLARTPREMASSGRYVARWPSARTHLLAAKSAHLCMLRSENVLERVRRNKARSPPAFRLRGHYANRTNTESETMLHEANRGQRVDGKGEKVRLRPLGCQRHDVSSQDIRKSSQILSLLHMPWGVCPVGY